MEVGSQFILYKGLVSWGWDWLCAKFDWLVSILTLDLIPVVSLFLTALVALWNYLVAERRQREDITRIAITDLTTGKVASARDELAKWVSDGRPDDLQSVRAYYFELCWAYQRGDTARRIWGKCGKKILRHIGQDAPVGLNDLIFHLKQIAVSAHQFHNSLNEGDGDLIEDADIWREIGTQVKEDVILVGVKEPESNDSYDKYFKARRKREESSP